MKSSWLVGVRLAENGDITRGNEWISRGDRGDREDRQAVVRSPRPAYGRPHGSGGIRTDKRRWAVRRLSVRIPPLPVARSATWRTHECLRPQRSLRETNCAAAEAAHFPAWSKLAQHRRHRSCAPRRVKWNSLWRTHCRPGTG